MRVGLLTTCIIDVMRPQVAASASLLIKKAGFTPIVPQAQTCCGQPALNAGKRDMAKQLMQKMAHEFTACDEVVAPSGSCIGAIVTHMENLFADDEAGHDEVRSFATKCMELSQFLTKHKYQPDLVEKKLRVCYHDSCAGFRELNIYQEPRDLLQKAGHELIPLKDNDVCCGFGGTFSVKFSEISSRMADNKCDCAVETKADVIAMGDLGCLLNIEGRLKRRGESMPVCHFAELIC